MQQRLEDIEAEDSYHGLDGLPIWTEADKEFDGTELYRPS